MAVKPYLQLVRLPNLFTAAADSLAGWFLAGGALDDWRRWLPLTLASVCTYAGGVVLNDVFDAEVDRAERPNRPIPSGRVPLRAAWAIGVGGLALGLALALVSGVGYAWAVELALIGCVLAYDAGLKKTPLGPAAMGSCRGLNVLLGMSRAPGFGGPVAWLVAGAYALFVAGITWVSRSEVLTGVWKNIAFGWALQNLAVAGLAWAAYRRDLFPTAGPASRLRVVGGLLILLIVAVILGARTVRAIRAPAPGLIQKAVVTGIFSLVILHVGVVASVRGPLPAVGLLAFWAAAVLGGRWVYST